MKNSRFKSLAWAALAAVGLTIFLYGHREDFGLGRNMEITINLMRELSLNYVDSVDTDKLLQGAADGMVRNLDPYTEYIPEKEMSEFEVLTTGKYGGIGSLIRLKGEYVIIAQPYENSPADKAGLKIGDKILAIGEESAKGFTTEQVSARLKGEPNTPVKVKIERLDGTIHEKEIMRERIAIPAISYAGWVNDSIGYIRHDDFTEGCASELQAAIRTLDKTGRLKGLVLDYRNNGGGIMQEAIKIVGLFTPRGTEVVRTKGRTDEKTYKTTSEPAYPDLPLVLLVNGGSASASEIVSGALQDMDRALLVGQRTLGKGLVQSTVPVGYNSMLKLTTAKYYIPSGRCIQEIDYSQSQQGSVREIPDSLIKEYTTRGGRKVYDGGGVMPDIQIKPEYVSRFAMTLYGMGFIEDFGDDYIRRNGYREIDPRTFRLTEQDFDDFVRFMEDKKVPYESETRQTLELIKKAAENDRFKEVQEKIEQLEAVLKDDTRTNLETYREEVTDNLTSDIVLRHAYARGVVENTLDEDSGIRRAAEMLADKAEYERILREQDTARK